MNDKIRIATNRRGRIAWIDREDGPRRVVHAYQVRGPEQSGYEPTAATPVFQLVRGAPAQPDMTAALKFGQGAIYDISGPLRETLIVGPRTFCAIDFETANPSRASICSVAVGMWVDGELVSALSTHVRPPPGHDEFAAHNVRVHGIRARDVVGAPPARAVLTTICRYLEALPLTVSHNAAFDSSVLRASAHACAVEVPAGVMFGCTFRMAKRLLRLDGPADLPAVCRHLGIEQGRHHEAHADMLAAAAIVEALDRRFDSPHLPSLLALADPNPDSAALLRTIGYPPEEARHVYVHDGTPRTGGRVLFRPR